MRFLIVSENGDAAGIAWRLQTEGNEVDLYIKNKAASRTLKGMVNHVSSIRDGVNNVPDVILFDMVGMGKAADQLRDSGWKVLGGGEWNDKLELDRKFAMKAMDSFGIRAPRSFAFKNLKDAAGFASEHSKLLVLKPNDNKNAAYTYVPKSQDELIGFIKHLKIDMKVDGKVLLQEYVDGTEVSTEIWYAGGRPVAMPNSTLETKKLMSGDVGPSTGCQTSLVFAYPKREPKLVQQSLKKMSLFLERTKYTGPLDINGIVRKGRFYGLEFTPRFGYSAIYALSRLLKEPLGKVLERIAQGDDSPMSLREGFGYSLRVSIPPYPYQPEDTIMRRKVYEKTSNLSVSGLTKEDWEKNVFPMDMYQISEGHYYTAGFDGVIMEATGFGLDPFEAEREAVRVFKKLRLPNKQARIGDGARNAVRRIEELRRQGYEVPPFEKPQTVGVEVIGGVTTIARGEPNEKNNDLGLAAKLGVRPGAFADPRVKGAG